MVIVVNDKKRRFELVADRIWLCGQLHSCSRCKNRERCQQLYDSTTGDIGIPPKKVERFFMKFEKLRSIKTKRAKV